MTPSEQSDTSMSVEDFAAVLFYADYPQAQWEGTAPDAQELFRERARRALERLRCSSMSQDRTPEQSDSPDMWASACGFRAVPCMDAQRRVWVEVDCPDRLVSMSTLEARELAEHLARVAATAEAWRGRKGRRS